MDPDGRQFLPPSIDDDFNKIVGEYLYSQDNAFSKGQGLNLLDGAGYDITDEAGKLVYPMSDIMLELGKESAIQSMEFFDAHGAKIAIAAYGSGRIGLGIVIDKVTIFSDITLIINDYMKTGDVKKLTEDLSASATSMALGALAKRASVFIPGHNIAEEVIQGVISNAVSLTVDYALNMRNESTDD